MFAFSVHISYQIEASIIQRWCPLLHRKNLPHQRQPTPSSHRTKPQPDSHPPALTGKSVHLPAPSAPTAAGKHNGSKQKNQTLVQNIPSHDPITSLAQSARMALCQAPLQLPGSQSGEKRWARPLIGLLGWKPLSAGLGGWQGFADWELWDWTREGEGGCGLLCSWVSEPMSWLEGKPTACV
jgi:hypothetical protein